MSYIGKMGYVSDVLRAIIDKFGCLMHHKNEALTRKDMKFLVTGAAGFIGSHVSKRLLDAGHQVVGIDNLNDYYDVNLKLARLDLLKSDNFSFHKLDLADREGMSALFADEKFDRVIHLAAQAGVRYSLDNPHAYAEANLVGHLNVLEGCRHNKVQHLLYA